MTGISQKDKEPAGEEREAREAYSLTQKGRRFMREDRYMKMLSESEQKSYEECMALVQTLGQNISLDEVCEWLEQYADADEEQ